MKKLNRAIRRTFRFSKDEDDKLTELAKSNNQTISEWVRDRVRLARVK